MQDVTSDAEIVRLINAAQQFESWAFDEIYNLYANKLYRFILFRVGNESQAEDLVAEVFVRVLDRIESFRGKTAAAFSAWMYRIARNLVTDHYRRQAKIGTVPLEDAGAVIDNTADPHQNAEKRQTRQELQQAITHLTPDQQQVILLKFFEGMGNAQVAQLMGKTEGSVKALQHRALAALGRFFGTGVKP